MGFGIENWELGFGGGGVGFRVDGLGLRGEVLGTRVWGVRSRCSV